MFYLQAPAGFEPADKGFAVIKSAQPLTMSCSTMPCFTAFIGYNIVCNHMKKHLIL
jgi:hypothetical protein